MVDKYQNNLWIWQNGADYFGVRLDIYKNDDVRGYGAATVPVWEYDMYRISNLFQMI